MSLPGPILPPLGQQLWHLSKGLTSKKGFVRSDLTHIITAPKGPKHSKKGPQNPISMVTLLIKNIDCSGDTPPQTDSSSQSCQ